MVVTLRLEAEGGRVGDLQHRSGEGHIAADEGADGGQGGVGRRDLLCSRVRMAGQGGFRHPGSRRSSSEGRGWTWLSGEGPRVCGRAEFSPPAHLRNPAYFGKRAGSVTCTPLLHRMKSRQPRKEPKMQNRRSFIRPLFSPPPSPPSAPCSSTAYAADTIKVGILHSLSGTMAISETALKETALMTIDEINAKGRRARQSSSRWWWTRPPTGRSLPKARQLLSQDKVAVTFGCWTSVSRKSVLPVEEGAQRPAVLPGAVRGVRSPEERLLHRRRAQPAGDPGGGIPDEQGKAVRPSASCCSAPTTSTRAPPTRSCAPS